jgi:peptidyl-dipeptidase A
MRYFLEAIVQFQFHRARPNRRPQRAAQPPLDVLQQRGGPWVERHPCNGQEPDATAIWDYFAPLQAWLDEQNKGKPLGW